MNRTVLTVAALSALALLPGCVAYEIRDKLTSTNSELGQVQIELQTVEQLRVEAIGELQRTNELLSRVATQLERVDKRLERLESVDRSLVSLDEQLLSVKGIVEGLSGVMSIFSRSRATEEAAPEGEGAEGAEGDPAADNPEPEGASDNDEADTDAPEPGPDGEE